MAGDDLTADICEYMRRQHNVKVSERMAERIQDQRGFRAYGIGGRSGGLRGSRPESDDCCLPMEVPGSLIRRLPTVWIKSISKIEAAILSALEQTPPELYADIVKNGIYLAGGALCTAVLDKRLRDKMNISSISPRIRCMPWRKVQESL